MIFQINASGQLIVPLPELSQGTIAAIIYLVWFENSQQITNGVELCLQFSQKVPKFWRYLNVFFEDFSYKILFCSW